MSVPATLAGRTAVVTGAGGGLGRAYATALAEAGAAVVVNDIDAEAADETTRTISAAGGDARFHVGAVGDAGTAEAIVHAAVEAFGRLDIMCTNAGVLRDRVLWKMTDDDFDRVIDTHLRGTFTCARAAAVQMREQADGGRLILIGSPAGQRGNFGQTNYAAAKAGIACLARTWALELSRSNITVNAVIPTAWTRMTETIPAFAPLAELVERGQPFPGNVRRDIGLGLPDDCAPLVVFLASEAAAGITGQCIGIGGDRLSVWSHPQEVEVAFADGGWTAEEIASRWSQTLEPAMQSYGIEMPDLALQTTREGSSS